MSLTDEENMRLLAFYRATEIRGSLLVTAILERTGDDGPQLELARHARDEARHSWLLTQHIADLGGSFRDAGDGGYQRALATVAGRPKGLVEFLALTLATEKRGLRQYVIHSNMLQACSSTRSVLNEIIPDERWHVRWISDWLSTYDAERGSRAAADAIARFRRAEAEAYGGLSSSLPSAMRDQHRATRVVATAS